MPYAARQQPRPACHRTFAVTSGCCAALSTPGHPPGFLVGVKHCAHAQHLDRDSSRGSLQLSGTERRSGRIRLRRLRRRHLARRHHRGRRPQAGLRRRQLDREDPGGRLQRRPRRLGERHQRGLRSGGVRRRRHPVRGCGGQPRDRGPRRGHPRHQGPLRRSHRHGPAPCRLRRGQGLVLVRRPVVRQSGLGRPRGRPGERDRRGGARAAAGRSHDPRPGAPRHRPLRARTAGGRRDRPLHGLHGRRGRLRHHCTAARSLLGRLHAEQRHRRHRPRSRCLAGADQRRAAGRLRGREVQRHAAPTPPGRRRISPRTDWSHRSPGPRLRSTGPTPPSRSAPTQPARPARPT